MDLRKGLLTTMNTLEVLLNEFYDVGFGGSSSYGSRAAKSARQNQKRQLAGAGNVMGPFQNTTNNGQGYRGKAGTPAERRRASSAGAVPTRAQARVVNRTGAAGGFATRAQARANNNPASTAKGRVYRNPAGAKGAQARKG